MVSVPNSLSTSVPIQAQLNLVALLSLPEIHYIYVALQMYLAAALTFRRRFDIRHWFNLMRLLALPNAENFWAASMNFALKTCIKYPNQYIYVISVLSSPWISHLTTYRCSKICAPYAPSWVKRSLCVVIEDTLLFVFIAKQTRIDFSCWEVLKTNLSILEKKKLEICIFQIYLLSKLFCLNLSTKISLGGQIEFKANERVILYHLI